MPARIPLEAGHFFHIYNHANGTENLFQTSENYQFFLKKYAEFLSRYVETYAYCLLPNHFHFLIRVREVVPDVVEKNAHSETSSIDAADAFKRFFSSYGLAFNRQQNRMGSLFMPNFRRKKIDSDEYLSKIIHYIHYNPVHHRFVKELELWPHSSYRTILSENPTLLERKAVLDWFGGRQAFIEFHKWKPDDEWSSTLEG